MTSGKRKRPCDPNQLDVDMCCFHGADSHRRTRASPNCPPLLHGLIGHGSPDTHLERVELAALGVSVPAKMLITPG